MQGLFWPDERRSQAHTGTGCGLARIRVEQRTGPSRAAISRRRTTPPASRGPGRCKGAVFIRFEPDVAGLP